MVAVAHRMPGAHPSQRALEPSEHGSRGQRRVQSEVRAAQNLASLYSRSDEGETIYILEPQSGSAQWSWMLRFGCAGTGHAVWCDGSHMQCGVHAMVKRMGVRAMAGRERTRWAQNNAFWRAPEVRFVKHQRLLIETIPAGLVRIQPTNLGTLCCGCAASG
jgi:hypothetical protein|eukprot:scaffold12377_cov119-Isochrysis_galbana.AAC.1